MSTRAWIRFDRAKDELIRIYHKEGTRPSFTCSFFLLRKSTRVDQNGILLTSSIVDHRSNLEAFLLLTRLACSFIFSLFFNLHLQLYSLPSPKRHNIIVDKPHDLSSRWSGASVAAMPVPSTSGMNVPSTSTSINTASTNPTGSGTGGSSPLLSGNGEAWTSSTGHLNIGSGISIRGNNPATTTTTRSSSSTLGTSSATTIQGGSNPSASSGRQYIILKLEKAAVVRESIETEGSKGRVWLELTFSSFHSSLLNFQKRLPLESTTKVRSNLQKETSRQEEDPNLVLWSLSLLFPSPAHPCNLRDFKVYGALSLPSSVSHEDETFPSNPEFALEKGVQSQVSNNGGWIKLLRGGLRNDSIPETFSLRWKDSEKVSFSIQYIKLVPLAAHQPNYNFSVWHISLSGVNENKVVEQVCREWKEYREKMTMRLILKHLRSRGHHSAFAMLLKSSGLGISNGNENSTSTSINQAYDTSPIDRSFEHPLLTRLYDAL